MCRCENGACGMLLGAGCDCRCHVTSEREALRGALEKARTRLSELNAELTKVKSSLRKSRRVLAKLRALKATLCKRCDCKGRSKDEAMGSLVGCRACQATWKKAAEAVSSMWKKRNP